jgi:hypothetical protein
MIGDSLLGDEERMQYIDPADIDKFINDMRQEMDYIQQQYQEVSDENATHKILIHKTCKEILTALKEWDDRVAYVGGIEKMTNRYAANILVRLKDLILEDLQEIIRYTGRKNKYDKRS